MECSRDRRKQFEIIKVRVIRCSSYRELTVIKIPVHINSSNLCYEKTFQWLEEVERLMEGECALHCCLRSSETCNCITPFS